MEYQLTKKVNGKTFTHHTTQLAADILLNRYNTIEVYVTTIQVTLGRLDQAEQVLRRHLIQPDELTIDYHITDERS